MEDVKGFSDGEVVGNVLGAVIIEIVGLILVCMRKARHRKC